MGRETDFLDLYDNLDLHPDCGLAEFKQAYRRRLAALHPDRQNGQLTPAHAQEELQRLMALYRTAMEFQRQYGRLPGAQLRSIHSPGPVPAFVPAELPRKDSRWLLALIGTIVVVLFLWRSDPSPEASDVSEVQAASTDEYTPQVARTAHALQIGMSPDAVEAIAGIPSAVSDDRWEYGPSWVRFENHKVVGWYSSALRPLETTQPEPAQP